VVNEYPGGSPRTPGYWKNWSTCSGGGQQYTASDNSFDYDGNGIIDGTERVLSGWALLDDILNPSIHGISWGDFIIGDANPDYPGMGCEIGVSILSAKDLASGRNRNSDAGYTLAKHLLAYQLNMGAGAYICYSDEENVLDMINIETWAVELLTCLGFNGEGAYLRAQDDYYSYALQLAKILDQYNNGMPCEGFADPLTGEWVNGLDELISQVTPVSFAAYANAGEDLAVCFVKDGIAQEFQLAADASAGEILWSIYDGIGNGLFSNDIIENPVYTFGTVDITNGVVTLELTVEGCAGSASDQIILTHDPNACVEPEVPTNPGKGKDKKSNEEDVMTSIDGILEFDLELKVYPNPFAHDVFFEMTPLRNTNFKLEIYSMTGQLLEVLYDDAVIAHIQYIFKFNGDNYGYSAFMVRVITDSGVGAGRILKIR
jgi:hypothetical protein